MVRPLRLAAFGGALVGTALLLVGCADTATAPASSAGDKQPAAPGTPAATPKGDGAHGHKPTAHGGTVVPDAGDHGPPSKVADADERALYLTPGGKYTEGDIRANGAVTASAKFKGLKAQHDVKPQPGDKLCPISMTKANPKFSWVIGGQTYEFCCPPCVDEFVALAKETPDAVRPPESYRRK